jgi:hypothetical protein
VNSSLPHMHIQFSYAVFFFSEKPGAEEWLALEKQKIPLLLNFSQCKLYEKDYYKVIEHCSSVLKTDPGELCKTEHYTVCCLLKFFPY